MNVLFVASECAPFVKTGGLADVVGAVPKALEQFGVKTRVLLPVYPNLRGLVEKAKLVQKFDSLFGGRANLYSVRSEGVDLLLLDALHLFDRPGGIYLDTKGKDWADNYLRFGALSYVGSEIATRGVDGWLPDLVHAHDWQAGLVPLYMAQSELDAPPCLFTIHNIAFQGLFDASVCKKLGVAAKMFTSESAEYFGKLGFLKAGIALSEKVTTVSPSYADELMLPEYGMGLEGLLQARKSDLSGITNGIDVEIWNPETDTALAATYSASTAKRKNKTRRIIEERFDLSPQKNGPLFCVVSRLTVQKGLDLLLDVLPELVGRGAQLAVLGTGEKELETAFLRAAKKHSGSVGVIIGYDEQVSHQLQGGSDAILVPSRYEPCGLTQLYGLRYGTIPVVARTGGLADTVIDANEAALSAGCATGIQFAPVNAQTLDRAISRACLLYGQPKVWKNMIRRAMRHQVGWDQSAKAYFDAYESLCQPLSAE